MPQAALGAPGARQEQPLSTGTCAAQPGQRMRINPRRNQNSPAAAALLLWGEEAGPGAERAAVPWLVSPGVTSMGVGRGGTSTSGRGPLRWPACAKCIFSQIKCSDLVKFEYIPGTQDKSQPLSLPHLPNFKLLLQRQNFKTK